MKEDPDNAALLSSIDGEDTDFGTNKSFKPTRGVPKIHTKSLVCVMFLGFVANLEYGVIMPSIWDYLLSLGGTESQLGLALSACSLLQLIFLPIYGIWSDRRTMREAACFAMVIGVVGNIVYASAQVIGSPWCIIAGRALVGVYSGVMAVSSSYISATTTLEERTRYMAMINGVNAIGLFSGPGFNIFMSKINFSVGGYVNVDTLTSPGWLIGFLLLITFFVYMSLFQEPEHVEHKGSEKRRASTKQYKRFLLQSYKKPYIACFLVTFVQNFNFSVLETITTPLTKELFNFTPFDNSLFYSAISVEMIAIILIVAVIVKKVSDTAVLLFGEICMGVGIIMCFMYLTASHLQFWVFAICVAILILGLPSQNTAIFGAYTKYLTEEYGPGKQGLYTGVMMVFGSLARILGPLWGGNAPNLKLLFLILIPMWILELVFTFVFIIYIPRRKRLSARTNILSINDDGYEPILQNLPNHE